MYPFRSAEWPAILYNSNKSNDIFSIILSLRLSINPPMSLPQQEEIPANKVCMKLIPVIEATWSRYNRTQWVRKLIGLRSSCMLYSFMSRSSLVVTRLVYTLRLLVHIFSVLCTASSTAALAQSTRDVSLPHYQPYSLTAFQTTSESSSVSLYSRFVHIPTQSVELDSIFQVRELRRISRWHICSWRA